MAKKVIKKEEKKLPKNHKVVIQKSGSIAPQKLTIGQKAADHLTKWAGSWTFIVTFFVIIFLWIGFNTIWIIFGRTWDSYPFILLNLALSLLAAIQAPIILMSQNRQGERDRMRFEYDYAVNRKAEKEISEMQKQLNRIEKRLFRK